MNDSCHLGVRIDVMRPRYGLATGARRRTGASQNLDYHLCESGKSRSVSKVSLNDLTVQAILMELLGFAGVGDEHGVACREC